MRHLDPDRSALEFVAPGLLHALGNSLFQLEGRLALLEGDGERHAQATAACRAAREVLDLARVLVADPAAPRRMRVRDVLEGLSRLLRVPLREAGLGLEVRDGPRGPTVDAGPLAAAVVEAVRRLRAQAPAGVGARIVLSTESARRDGAVFVGLENAPGGLPFAVDVEAAAAAVEGEIAGSGVQVERTAQGLRLLPVRPARRIRGRAPVREAQADSSESVA